MHKLRYFIVSYLYGREDFGSGVRGIISYNYPNVYKIKKEVFVDNLTVINIMEVTEEDYNSFWDKE